MSSSQSNLALCANLSDLVKKVILAFCEVNVSFTHRLDVYGSVHVRSDDADVTSFVLNEHCRKECGPQDESDDSEQTLIRQTSRSDGSHRKPKSKHHALPESSSENGRNRFEERMSDVQLKTAHESHGDSIDSSTSVEREFDVRAFSSGENRLRDEPELNGIISEGEEKSQTDNSKPSSRHQTERAASDGENVSPAGEAGITEGVTEYDGTRRRQYDSNSWALGDGSGREMTDELKTKRVAKRIKLEATRNANTPQVKTEPLSCVNDVIDLDYDDEDNVGNDELDYNNLGYDPATEEGAEAAGEEEGQLEYQNNNNQGGYSQADMYNQQLSSWIHSSGGRQGVPPPPPHDGGGPFTKRSFSNANVCGYCMKNCYSSLQLRVHIERHHNGGLSKIDDPEFSASPSHVSSAGYLPQTSSSGASFQGQQPGDAGQDRLVCSMCDLSFKSLDGLRCHENSKHSMNKVYRCQFCSQAFLTRQAAYTHRIRFHRVKPKLGHSMG